MTNIKSFKKGDWVSFSKIIEKNGEYVLENPSSDLCLYFVTDKECVYGKSQVYDDNPYKYWFDVKEEELIKTQVITRSELIEKYKSHEIEIHKYRQKNDKSWNVYSRAKKDFNWKFSLAVGINPGWVMFKKEMLDSYLADLEEMKQTKNALLIKLMEQAVDELIQGLRSECKIKGTFSSQVSAFSNIPNTKTQEYFEAMLKNYANLQITYRSKMNTDLYYMLLDFESVIEDGQKYFSKTDREIIRKMMKGETGINDITEHINEKFQTVLKKPLKKEDIKAKLDITIPKAIYKASDRMDRECETNG